MSWLSVFLSGNFQYDAGVLGFLKVLEKFYPNQYELAKGELRFSLKVLDDFNLSWFKMILLQNDIFNNSLYGKKKQNINRVMLHAREIYFIHPSNKKLSIIAPMFEDFKKLLPKGTDYEKIDSLSDSFTTYKRMCTKF